MGRYILTVFNKLLIRGYFKAPVYGTNIPFHTLFEQIIRIRLFISGSLSLLSTWR